MLVQSPVNGCINFVSVNSAGSGSDSNSPVKKEEPSSETDPLAIPLHPPPPSQPTTAVPAATSIVEKAMAGWSVTTAGSCLLYTSRCV